MSVRIQCINKSEGDHDNPNEAISHYGWINEDTDEHGKSNRLTMVEWLEEGNKAYVKDNNGNIAYCDVRTSKSGNKFLQTHSDGYYNNNLLSLPEC